MKVDFWLINQVTTDQSYWRWLCELLEQRYLSGDSVLVVLTKERLLELDRLLWVFKDGSLVPHKQYLDPEWNLNDYPIALIAWEDLQDLDRTVAKSFGSFTWLINASGVALPTDRLKIASKPVELVPAVSEIRKQMRKVYQEYAARGGIELTSVVYVEVRVSHSRESA